MCGKAFIHINIIMLLTINRGYIQDFGSGGKYGEGQYPLGFANSPWCFPKMENYGPFQI